MDSENVEADSSHATALGCEMSHRPGREESLSVGVGEEQRGDLKVQRLPSNPCYWIDLSRIRSKECGDGK